MQWPEAPLEPKGLTVGLTLDGSLWVTGWHQEGLPGMAAQGQEVELCPRELALGSHHLALWWTWSLLTRLQGDHSVIPLTEALDL